MAGRLNRFDRRLAERRAHRRLFIEASEAKRAIEDLIEQMRGSACWLAVEAVPDLERAVRRAESAAERLETVLEGEALRRLQSAATRAQREE